jgi:hypothetical protein
MEDEHSIAYGHSVPLSKFVRGRIPPNLAY